MSSAEAGYLLSEDRESFEAGIFQMRNLQKWEFLFVISLTQIKNKRGPKKEPCGTPNFVLRLVFYNLFSI